MTDFLKTDAPLRGILPVYLGYSHLTDNHGNSLIGRELTCKGRKSERVSALDFAWLIHSIDNDTTGALPEVRSTITYDGMKSPLEIECKALAVANPGHSSRGRADAAYRH